MKKQISVAVIIIGLVLTSCSTSKSCHSHKAYVSKDIKRAQSKPRNY
jgi:outer membrane lipoprotein SlyB